MVVPEGIAALRRRFAEDVLGYRVRASRNWNKDCTAYNVHIERRLGSRPAHGSPSMPCCP